MLSRGAERIPTLADRTDRKAPAVASSNAATAPVFPPGRYGRRRDPVRRRRRRVVTVVLAALVAAAGFGVAAKLYSQYVQAPYQVSDVATVKITDTAVTVSFDLTVPAGSGASCTIIGQTRTGGQVGRAEFAVPAPANSATMTHVTYTLTTSGRAFVATVPGCGPTRS
jgi:hypothetical protein